MLKAIEMELETGHYSFDILQNALVVGQSKGGTENSGTGRRLEKFREIIWVLSEKAITRAEILTLILLRSGNFQRDKLIKVERSFRLHSAMTTSKYPAESVLTFTDGKTLTMTDPRTGAMPA